MGYIFQIYWVDLTRYYDHVLEFSIVYFLRLCGRNLKSPTEGSNCRTRATFQKGNIVLYYFTLPRAWIILSLWWLWRFALAWMAKNTLVNKKYIFKYFLLSFGYFKKKIEVLHSDFLCSFFLIIQNYFF